MFLSKFSITRPVTITMIILAIIIAGTLSFFSLPVDLLPGVSQPTLRVVTEYDGGTPLEIEKEITKKIEDELSSVKQVTLINSASKSDESEIKIIFDWGKNLDLSVMEVQEKIDLVINDLPENAKKPVIEKFDPNSMPVIIYNCISNLNPEVFSFLLNMKIKPELERTKGVARVKIIGAEETEIKIVLDANKLFARKISINDVKNTLENENLNYQGGKFKLGKYDILIRTIGEYKSANELKNLILKNNNNNIVYLKDVAIIKKNFKQSTEINHYNGKKTVAIEIYKESNGNTIETSEKIIEKIKSIAKTNHKIDFNIIYNQAEFINNSVDMVKSNALTGAFLAIIVLYLFLRSFSSTIIIFTAMPISVIGALILFYFSKMSLNIFSLAGLALGVGMVVDNAVVILENIYRHLNEGRSTIEAAISASTEVGPAVFSSTATTLAVFIPIAFISGQAGIIFRDLSLTITFTMIFSLFVAFTFIPMLSSKYLKLPSEKNNFILNFFDKLGNIILDIYQKAIMFVTSSVQRRSITFLIGIVMIFIVLLLIPEKEFFPRAPQKKLSLNLFTNKKYSLEYTAQKIKTLEKNILKLSEIKNVNSNIEHGKVKLTIELKNKNKSKTVQNKIKNILKTDIFITNFILENNSQVEENMGLTGNGDILITVTGQNFSQIKNISNSIIDKLKNVPEIEKYLTEHKSDVKELNIKIDSVKATDLGLTLKQIGEEIKNKLVGVIKTSIKQNNKTLDIKIINDNKKLTDFNQINNLFITTSNGSKIKLGSISKILFKDVSDVIYHENKAKSNEIKIWIKDNIPLGKIIKKFMNDSKTGILDKLEIPENCQVKIRGLSQTLLDSFKELGISLLFAIIFVYMIMAAQFESLIHPITILVSVPLALLGAFIGLHIVGLSLSITALIGIIMLVGIVVNNAIILIDYTNILRHRGYDRMEAIKNAGITRLRPIFITACTTIMGMLPLSLGFGAGAELYQGLAVVIVFGLFFSTFLTLLYVPTIYCFFDDIGDFISLIIFRIKLKFEKFDDDLNLDLDV